MGNDRAIVAVDDVVDQVVKELERLQKGNYGNESETLALMADDVRVLGDALKHTRATMEGLVASAATFKRQRDMAMNAADLVRMKRGEIIREVAQAIGLGARVTQQDMVRVLEALTGESDLPVDEELLERAYNILHQLAEEMFVTAELAEK